jgi:hypothetical protein
MPGNDYHFITTWRLRASAQEVIDILRDAQNLPRWWPSVYLEVKQLAPGDENGVGQRIALHTKGWLPYTLRWQFTVTEVRLPATFALEADGDFVGRGIWSFQPDGEWVNVTYDWKIRAEKPLLRLLSPLLKPIFAMNHHWAMARGEESLHLELLRQRTTDPAQRARIAASPAPTPSRPLPWLGYVLRHGRG